MGGRRTNRIAAVAVRMVEMRLRVILETADVCEDVMGDSVERRFRNPKISNGSRRGKDATPTGHVNSNDSNVFNNCRRVAYCNVFVLRLKLPNGNSAKTTVSRLRFHSNFLDCFFLRELGKSRRILRLSAFFSRNKGPMRFFS